MLYITLTLCNFLHCAVQNVYLNRTWKMGMFTNYKTTYSLASWGTTFNHIEYIIYISFPEKVRSIYCRNVTRVKQGLSLATTNPDDL